MFHKYEWLFQVILFIGILYTACIVGYAVYLISLGE